MQTYVFIVYPFGNRYALYAREFKCVYATEAEQEYERIKQEYPACDIKMYAAVLVATTTQNKSLTPAAE